MPEINDIAKLSYYHGIKTVMKAVLESIEKPENKDIMSVELVKLMLNNNISLANSKLLELADKGICVKDILNK